MIFFSIIIPTYNRDKLIIGTVDSVLSQTYPHFEVIIVDDGSTDKTGETILEKYNKEGKVKYFLKKNEERGAARNYGLKQAKGDYAVFFDSDDLMKTHYLDILTKIIIEYPEVRLLAVKYDYDNNGKVENHPTLITLKEGWYDRGLFLKGNVLACNYCVRLKDHEYKPFPPERELASMEDWLFLLANLAEEKIFIRDEVCLTMRQHDERSMSNNQKVIDARIKATDWALNKLQLSSADQRTLIAWSHYFCGIHYYLDHKRSASVKEVITAIKGAGIHKQFLFLLIKSIVGRKLIRAIK
jgi:glycosyltransferase involved in cell wall biosynthesis